MGVHLGNAVGKDMIAVQISAPVRMAMIATPVYLKGKRLPESLQVAFATPEKIDLGVQFLRQKAAALVCP